jgi:hypothetical protein
MHNASRLKDPSWDARSRTLRTAHELTGKAVYAAVSRCSKLIAPFSTPERGLEETSILPFG